MFCLEHGYHCFLLGFVIYIILTDVVFGSGWLRPCLPGGCSGRQFVRRSALLRRNGLSLHGSWRLVHLCHDAILLIMSLYGQLCGRGRMAIVTKVVAYLLPRDVGPDLKA